MSKSGPRSSEQLYSQECVIGGGFPLRTRHAGWQMSMHGHPCTRGHITAAKMRTVTISPGGRRPLRVPTCAGLSPKSANVQCARCACGACPAMTCVPWTIDGRRGTPTKGAACLQARTSTGPHTGIYGLFCSHLGQKTHFGPYCRPYAKNRPLLRHEAPAGLFLNVWLSGRRFLYN